MSKDVEKTEYGTGTWDTPPSDEDYTLEEILAEYGSSRQQKIMEEVERETAPAEPDTPKAPAPEQPSAPKPTETAPSPTPKSAMALWEERIAAAALEQDGEAPLADDSDPEEEPRTDDGPEPEATRFLSLEELVGTTVGAVMEEHHETLLKPKWGLFSRKRQEETEQLYDSMEAPEEPVKPLTEAESIGEEPELSEVASEEREAYKRRHRSLGFAFFTALVPIAAMAAEQSGVTVPFWTGDRQIQGVAMLACLLIELVLCWHVPVYAIRKLSENAASAHCWCRWRCWRRWWTARCGCLFRGGEKRFPIPLRRDWRCALPSGASAGKAGAAMIASVWHRWTITPLTWSRKLQGVPASRGETCGAFTPPPCGMIMPPVFRRCSCR